MVPQAEIMDCFVASAFALWAAADTSLLGRNGWLIGLGSLRDGLELHGEAELFEAGDEVAGLSSTGRRSK
jgi:hypothetical protein